MQSDVTADARTAVHNAGLLVAQRGLLIVGGLLLAALIPRMMGPEAYGQYALPTSLGVWFVLFSALGFTQVIGRYAPPLVLSGNNKALRRLFGNLLGVRLVSSTLAAGLYLLFVLVWLRELDNVFLALTAGAVLLRALANLCYLFFLGLNQAARWGQGELIRQWGTLAFLIPGFLWGGLRGAGLALFLAELAVLARGLWGIRSYLSWSSLDVEPRYLIPYLRFGLGFFASNLLLAAFHRSGEAALRAIVGDYVHVGYFGVAYSIYLMAPSTMLQLTLAFAPLLTRLHVEGQVEMLCIWLERLLKWLAISGILVIFSVLLLGADLVRLILGPAFDPVAVNLIPLTLSLLMLALSSVASLAALVHDQPRAALMAAGVRLVAFWILAPPLMQAWRSLGGCLAVLGASIVYAAYFTRRTQRVVGYSLRSWALVTLLGSGFLPLVALRAGGWRNLLLYSAFVIGYGALLLLLRLVTVDELLNTYQAIQRRGT